MRFAFQLCSVLTLVLGACSSSPPTGPKPSRLAIESPPTDAATIVAGEPVVAVALDIGPDDGPAFAILVGKAGQEESRTTVKVGGLVGSSNDLCQFDVESHVMMHVEFYPEMDKPRTLEVGKHLFISRSCTDGESCESIKRGLLVIDSYTPGVGAKGHYTLQTDSGLIESAFDAKWCGPNV